MKRQRFSGLVSCSALLLLSLVCGLPAEAASFPERVVVAKEGDEEEVFDKIQDELVKVKVSAAVAREALKGFDRYIDKRVERESKPVNVYPQGIFEVAKTAALKGWAGADISFLLIHIQGQIDSAGRSADDAKRVAVKAIADGKGRKEVIAALDAGRAAR